jgi:hypothetical protein
MASLELETVGLEVREAVAWITPGSDSAFIR